MIDMATARRCSRCRVVGVEEEDFARIRDRGCTAGWRWDSWCRGCRREVASAAKARAQARALADPDEAKRQRSKRAAQARSWRERNPDKDKALRLRADERRNMDPDARAQRAELARINHRLRMER